MMRVEVDGGPGIEWTLDLHHQPALKHKRPTDRAMSDLTQETSFREFSDKRVAAELSKLRVAEAGECHLTRFAQQPVHWRTSYPRPPRAGSLNPPGLGRYVLNFEKAGKGEERLYEALRGISERLTGLAGTIPATPQGYNRDAYDTATMESAALGTKKQPPGCDPDQRTAAFELAAATVLHGQDPAYTWPRICYTCLKPIVWKANEIRLEDDNTEHYDWCAAACRASATAG